MVPHEWNGAPMNDEQLKAHARTCVFVWEENEKEIVAAAKIAIAENVGIEVRKIKEW